MQLSNEFGLLTIFSSGFKIYFTMMTIPDSMIPDLRIDHAGETGAVAIYRTILKLSHDKEISGFAGRHLSSEISHQSGFAEILQLSDQSRILFIWIKGGFFIAAITLLFGRRWIFGVIKAVEAGVVSHYQTQLNNISNQIEYNKFYSFLKQCMDDEILHRDEAALKCGKEGFCLNLWCRMIQAGSNAVIMLTRKF